VTVDGLIVGFYDEASASLDVRYAIEKGRRLPAARHPVEEGRGLSSWVILNDEDLLLGSREEAERYDPSVTLLEGSRHISESFLIVRLKIEGRIIGVLSVQSVEPGRYRQRHLKVLQALAGFVAIALSNSSAHQNLLVAKEEIAYMATHDPLTGLPNRMQIIERLNQELKRCQRYDESLAVLFIDLDGFKEINDGHGHRAGDAVLKELSTRLTKGIRSTDAVGRLAGDEFLVILTDDCSPANGMLLAEQHDEWAVGQRYFSQESMALLLAVDSWPPQLEAAK